jgi:hypothetical protein
MKGGGVCCADNPQGSRDSALRYIDVGDLVGGFAVGF